MHLLIIDPQNDFCDPNGSLFVNGADADMRRAADFIRKHKYQITDITVTFDSHYVYDIAHPGFWKNSKGEHPKPVDTVITLDDLKNGTWMPTNPGEIGWCHEYLEKLEESGRYPHRIWPEHCLIGSWGHACHPELLDAIHEWERDRVAKFNAVTKGSNYRVEHFSAVRAEVEDPEDQEGTGLNIQYVETIRDPQGKLIVLGEALDFCVANTLRDTIKEFGPDFAQNIVILRDCTSSVLPPEVLENDFVAEMEGLNVAFENSENYSPEAVTV